MKKLVYLFLFGIIFTSQAQDYWTGLNGPFGGTINDIVSPSAGVMLASTANGVYRSTNSGASWSRMALGSDNSFSDLEIDPSSGGNKIFAATNNGARVYVSSDAGVTWTQLVATGITLAVTKIKVASTGTTIYMTDTGLRVLKSTNSGADFSTLQTFSGTTITDLDLDNLNNVYVSTNGQGIKVSNGIAAFTTPSTGSLTGSSIVYSTVIKSSTEIFCLSSNGAHKSTNAGGVYALISTGLTDPSYSGIIDVDAGGNIFVCNNNVGPQKIYTSTAASAGASWSFVSAPFWSLSVTASYFESLASFYVGLGNIGVVKATSNGTSWANSTTGIKSIQTSNKIFISPQNNYLFVSGTGLGYYSSLNNGATWNYNANGATNRNIVGFVKLSDNSILGYGSGGVIRSDNDESFWFQQSTQILNELVTSDGVNLFSYSGTSILTH